MPRLSRVKHLQPLSSLILPSTPSSVTRHTFQRISCLAFNEITLHFDFYQRGGQKTFIRVDRKGNPSSRTILRSTTYSVRPGCAPRQRSGLQYRSEVSLLLIFLDLLAIWLISRYFFVLWKKCLQLVEIYNRRNIVVITTRPGFYLQQHGWLDKRCIMISLQTSLLKPSIHLTGETFEQRRHAI